MSIKKSHTCLICNKSFYKLGSHLQTHNLTAKEYYDIYLKKDNEGICKICSSTANFTNSIYEGYGTYCSRSCRNKDPKIRAKQRASLKKTLKENPDIISNRQIKVKETYRDNPDIIIKSLEKRAQTLKENPEIQINATKKQKETYKNNPEILISRSKKSAETCRTNPHIIEQANKKRKETLSNNPDIILNRTKKFKAIIENNPSILEERNSKNSILLRERHSKLRSTDSPIPHFLYVVKSVDTDIIKIGVTHNTTNRFKIITRAFGNINIIKVLQGTCKEIYSLELALHKKYEQFCKVLPSGSGRTEWFDSIILPDVLTELSTK